MLHHIVRWYSVQVEMYFICAYVCESCLCVTTRHGSAHIASQQVLLVVTLKESNICFLVIYSCTHILIARIADLKRVQLVHLFR